MPSIRQCSTRRRSHQPPPSTSSCSCGIRERSCATALSASSICLCGTSRDNTATRGVAERGSANVWAGASSSPLRTTATRSGDTPRATRSRAEGSDTVTYWLRPVHPRRHRRLDIPAEPAEQRAGDRPLIAVAVVHQHHDPAAEQQPRQERPPVLGVDHDVGTGAAQRSQPEPGDQQGQQGPGVHAVAATGAADPHTLDGLAARGTAIAGGAQCDPHPGGRQLRPDPLQVGLAAAALGVAGVAPAQQQHGVNPRTREATNGGGLRHRRPA